MHTICISCGAAKEFFNEVCPACSFEPRTTEELAKSRILSDPYSFTLPDGDLLETGRSPAELLEISERLSSGSGYEFSRDEVDKVARILIEVESMRGRDIAWEFAKWFGPPVSILIFVYWLLTRAS